MVFAFWKARRPIEPVPGAELPDDAPVWRREHYIPIRGRLLVKNLLQLGDLSDREREQLQQLADVLSATFHFEYHDDLEHLKEAYAPFNPDEEGELDEAIDQAERDRRLEGLFERVIRLVERANYRRLSRLEIEQAVDAASHWGVHLNLDFSAFHKLEVFSRGDVIGRRSIRRWTNYYREEEVDVEIYRRLLVIFQLQDHKWVDAETDLKCVYLKLFKNIPKVDVDMLLPATQIRMSMLDRGKIILPTLSGTVVTIVKIVKGAALSLLTGFTTGLVGMLALLGFIAATIGYGLKSFFGYLHTKDKYQLSLTRNLYYQNLGNNLGVLFRILDEAEEQEFREAILAYYLLWRHGNGGWTQDQLDQRAEQLLHEMLDSAVDFETQDAVAKLLRLGLAVEDADGLLHVVPIDEALERLDRAWDRYFEFHRL